MGLPRGVRVLTALVRRTTKVSSDPNEVLTRTASCRVFFNGPISIRYAPKLTSLGAFNVLQIRYCPFPRCVFPTACTAISLRRLHCWRPRGLKSDNLGVKASKLKRCAKPVSYNGNPPTVQVVVWNVTTKHVRSTVTGFHTVGIAGLTWSPCGGLLASIGADECHSLQIMEAFTAKPIFRVRYDNAPLFWVMA